MRVRWEQRERRGGESFCQFFVAHALAFYLGVMISGMGRAGMMMKKRKVAVRLLLRSRVSCHILTSNVNCKLCCSVAFQIMR
jgi:hypothetical protein